MREKILVGMSGGVDSTVSAKILKDKHSKLILKKGSDELCAICFNKILDEDQIRLIAGSPFVNTFNNSLEIKIRDVR